jgi:hypothetical protein
VSTGATIEPTRNKAISTSASALRRMASYVLPAELDRRILNLGERKKDLTEDERAELLAWVQFTQERSIEKHEAQLALRELAHAFPDVPSKP